MSWGETGRNRGGNSSLKYNGARADIGTVNLSGNFLFYLINGAVSRVSCFENTPATKFSIGVIILLCQYEILMKS